MIEKIYTSYMLNVNRMVRTTGGQKWEKNLNPKYIKVLVNKITDSHNRPLPWLIIPKVLFCIKLPNK